MTTTAATFPHGWQIAQDFSPTDHLMQLERFDKRTQRKVTTEYLNVQNRLIWFIRDQRELIASGLAKMPYIIQTDLVESDRAEGWAQFKTYVRDVLGNEATMYGSESSRDFPDYIEKASTKSLGRALLLLGYGTAFVAELDEGERIVDAPVERPQLAAQAAPRPVSPPARPAPVASALAPAANTEVLANERQVASIRKLCAALHRAEPDFAHLTFAAARELLTELSRAYSEARRAG